MSASTRNSALATKWGMNGWSESLRLELQPAEVIAFAVNRPRHLAIHEVLLRPAGQATP